MAASIDDITAKLDGFEAVMTKMLDKLNTLDAWRVSADELMTTLLTRMDDMVSRLHRLECAPPPPPPPPSPPPPPPGWVHPIDLNLAPPPATRPSASTWERPNGHRHDFNHRDVGGGILGSRPPHPVTGMSHAPPLHFDSLGDPRPSSSRSTPLPKLEFPKFDGENPRLWKDRCEQYFEVYSISDSLKPRFAALNFTDVAANWLLTYELRHKITSWEELCLAVCERFNKDQYHTNMKQLDVLTQTGSVAEYVA